MTINLNNNYEVNQKIEIAINESFISFQWQDNNEMWQGIELNLKELKKWIKYLESSNKDE